MLSFEPISAIYRVEGGLTTLEKGLSYWRINGNGNKENYHRKNRHMRFTRYLETWGEAKPINRREAGTRTSRHVPLFCLMEFRFYAHVV